MNLGFKPIFVPLILSGEKIHTIRHDNRDRWVGGRKIHYATGIRTNKYNCFKQGACVSTQKIEFKWINLNDRYAVEVFIDDRNVTNETEVINALVKNDGFKDRKEFFEWDSWDKKDFAGKIIHWTDLRY